MKKAVWSTLIFILIIGLINTYMDAAGVTAYKYLYPINVKGKWGYMDSREKVVVKPQYAAAKEFSEGRAAVCMRIKGIEKWGYIDSNGKIIVKPQYEMAYDFHEGMAAVAKGGYMPSVVFIDGKGKEILEVKDSGGYRVDPGGFNGGLVALYMDMHMSTTVKYIDKKGNIISETQVFYPETEVSQYRSGLRKITEINGKIGYIDITGKIVIAPQYNKAMDAYMDIAWVRKDNGWMLIDKSGKELNITNYQIVSNYYNGYAKVQSGQWDIGKWGYIDKSGNMIIEPKYNYAFNFSEGLAAVKLKGFIDDAIGISDGGIEYIDSKGDTIIPPAYQFANEFQDNLAHVYNGEHVFIDKAGKIVFKAFSPYAGFNEGYLAVKLNNGKFQYWDKEGKQAIDGIYDEAYNFKEGLARVVVSGKYGFIDTKGNVIIEPKYSYANDFSEGLALMGEKDKYSYVDKTGKAVFNVSDMNIIQYQSIISDGANCYGVELNSDFHEGLAAVRADNKTGFIDNSGKMVIQPQYDFASAFSEGYAIAKKGKAYGFIDRSGQFVIKPQFSIGSGFKDGMAVIIDKKDKYRQAIGFIDKSGKVIVYPQFDDAGPFCNGIAKVKTGCYSGAMGLVNIKGDVVLKPQYQDLGLVSENLVSVLVNKKWGYMDIYGNMVIKPQFEEANEFRGGVAKVLLNGKTCYVNKNGKFIWK